MLLSAWWHKSSKLGILGVKTTPGAAAQKVVKLLPVCL